MIKDLTEAIAHAKEKAKELNDTADNWKRLSDEKGLALPSDYEPCKECATEHEQLAGWLEELDKRRKTEPIVYEITEDSQGFVVETKDDRNIGLKKVSTHNLISAMRKITEKYWDEGLRVVFKYYCGNGDEWQKCYESEVENG